ncbi:hypothetical protein [Agrobacterium sp. SORGH_AS 787]|uniref:hypothetical protein n=1 Tax=Agrobacterium sp. SORGH_AS 787 TaxID=3041775 RepID=UPI0027880732|nr:hypothetical protein [Rhizobium sp. SORGH_AS_0787]
MSNITVPATAEGMSEIHIENRITELASEISKLMERTTQPATLIIFQASTGLKPRYEASVGVGESRLSSALTDGVDNLDAARSILDLLNFALDAMSGDANLRTEVNALQFGMNGLGKHLSEAKAEIEKARSLVT